MPATMRKNGIRNRFHRWRIGSRLAAFGVLFGVYWLMVGRMTGVEIVAGMVIAAVAMVAVIAVQRQGRMRFAVWAGAVTPMMRLPRRFMGDCVHLAAALWRAGVRREEMRGTVVRIPFNVGDRSPESAGRRALVVFGICFAPNTIAILIDSEAGEMCVHRLMPAPAAKEDEWPT